MTPAEATAKQAELALISKAMIATTLELERIEKLKPDQFHDPRHSIIWTAILDEIRSGEKDAPSLAIIERLTTDGSIETAGGFSYVNDISNWSMNKNLPDFHAAIDLVIKCSRMRRISLIAKATADAADGLEPSTSNSLIHLRKALEESTEDENAKCKNALESLLHDLEDTFRSGIRTNTPLDKRFDLTPGRLYVIGGRPGHGKTTLSLQLALCALSANPDAHVLVASCEMTEPELSLKALCCLDGNDHITPLRSMDGANASKSIAGAVGMYAHILERLHLICTRSMDEVSTLSHTIGKQRNLMMLVVDYLSAMQPPGGVAYETRTREVGATSRACKQLAQHLDCVVIAASQLRRPTKDTTKPTLRELRDSGEIEQDSDGVLLLFRPDHEKEDSPAQLLIAKNRWGELGAIDIVPDLANHRFGWRSHHEKE